MEPKSRNRHYRSLPAQNCKIVNESLGQPDGQGFIDHRLKPMLLAIVREPQSPHSEDVLRLSPSHRWWRAFLLLAALLVISSQPGCVFRRMTINSDPPGALVKLDGEEVGHTPYTGDFTYYGTREITLIKPGYETLTVNQKVSPPWYQYPGVDFFAENLSPFKVTNRQAFQFHLEPQREVSNDELLDRANAHRSEIQVGR
jgi:hypothetical protein